MKRREFIALFAAAVAAWAEPARAQEPGRTYRLGVFIPSARNSPQSAAFLDELRINGFIEGNNLAVIWTDPDLSSDEVPQRAAALVKVAPDGIAAGPELPIRAVQAATSTIPIIGMSEDMVGEHLVASLAHPGGNTTGISLLSPELDGKRQDILIEATPGVRRIAAFAEANVYFSPRDRHFQELQAAGRNRGVEVSIVGISASEQIVPAINAAKDSGAEALNFLASPLFSVPASRNSRIVIERATELRLPTMFQWPETAEQGGLLAYGPRFAEVYRQRARMVAKVLRGTKPSDIPVEQPTSFELVVNTKTAKIIQHNVPAGLVLRADKVIE
jgi:putative tryptophan/tyrosine transport system substrate-binding protein